MLNSCPKYNSCGTLDPWYTDADMPTAVGVPTAISAYEVGSVGDCPGYPQRIEVIRCSWRTDHDLIYKQVKFGFGTCRDAFCGMK